MNIHDKSQQKGLAFIFTIFLFIIIFAVAKCGGNNSDQATIPKPDTPQYYGANPSSLPKTDTPERAPDFEKMASMRGDIYYSRHSLIKKLKQIDPYCDFSGSFDGKSEASDDADDEFTGMDKFGCNIMIIGSQKHVKELSFAYYPSPLSDSKTFIFNGIAKATGVMCKNTGTNWVSLQLGVILIQPNSSFRDSVVIEDKKLLLAYDGDNKSVDFTITHK